MVRFDVIDAIGDAGSPLLMLASSAARASRFHPIDLRRPGWPPWWRGRRATFSPLQPHPPSKPLSELTNSDCLSTDSAFSSSDLRIFPWRRVEGMFPIARTIGMWGTKTRSACSAWSWA